MRRYEAAWLTPSGDILDVRRIAPVHPVFEAAFSAFGRGALITTETGPCAVEDLLPGDRIVTSREGKQTIRWIGSVTLVPGTPGSAPLRMTRLRADTFGPGRPTHDLVLGPTARILHRAPALATRIGTDRAFAPAESFADGTQVISLMPAAPVQVFHLITEVHDSLYANGLEVETFHPGRASDLNLGEELLSLYLTLFPQIRRLADFGPLSLPRIADPRSLVA